MIKISDFLRNLEHLAVEGTDLFSIRLEKHLKLTLDLSGRGRNEGEVVLDCPELRALAIDCHQSKSPLLNCPKLEHLKYVNYRDWVAKLANLEVLSLLSLGHLETNAESFLQNHPKLHTLNVFMVKKVVVKELIRSKKLGRGDLRIFCRSLPVENDDVLKDFDQIFSKKRLIGSSSLRREWNSIRSMNVSSGMTSSFLAKKIFVL